MEKGQLIAYLRERLALLLEMEADLIKDKDRFSALGLTSAKATLLSVELSEKLKKKISPTTFYSHPTLEDLGAFLSGERPAAHHKKSGKKKAEVVPIAVVGMACRFPQAHNLRAFWHLLEGEQNAITEIPAERWDIDDYYDPDSSLEGKIQTRYGGFIEGIEEFDPYFFDISPREASEMSPDQKICMELAWEAFAHAKIRVSDLMGSPVGVFIGNVWNDFAHLRIKKHAPINQHSAIGQSANIIANRISYAFGFQGPSLVIDSACSSSLYAVHLACQAIHNGDCEVALAGGVNVMLDPDTYVYMSKFGGLSPTGQCHTFDADADGYVRGEGAGMIVLKPLHKAIKDGDRVFAVVRGSAVNNDGASNSLTAPNLEAQKNVLHTAYERAGISPSDVHYIEAHGTGTKLGDPIEAEALGAVLGEERLPSSPLLLGSVKTNIGHLEGAAGIAGLIKVVLSIQKQRIPRSLNYQNPNPYIPFDEWKLKVAASPTDWPVQVGETRKAGVSAFGWGGTNAHVVVEEFVDAKPEVLVIAGDTEEKLRRGIEGVQKLFDKIKETNDTKITLKNIAAVYANYDTDKPHRIALKAESLPELQKKVFDLMTGADRSKQAYILPEQQKKQKVVFAASPFGGQYVGMGIVLLGNSKEFRARFKQCDYHFKKVSGWSLFDKIQNLEEEDLANTGIMVPLVNILQISLHELLVSYGVNPDVVVGHSIGEMAAAHIAGFITLEDVMPLTYHYSRLIHSIAGDYAMAVVGKSAKLVEKDLQNYPDVYIAAINSEDSCNISGTIAQVDAFIKYMNNEGTKATKINNRVPAHTPFTKVYHEELHEYTKHIKPLVPKIPMYSTTLGRYMQWEDLVATSAENNYWCKNISHAVLFSPAVQTLLGEDYNNFVELSPHPVLKHYISQGISYAGKQATIHHALERDKEETITFQNLLMLLYLQGFDIKWNKHYSKYLIHGGQATPEEGAIEYNDMLALPISAKTEQSTKDYAQEYLDFLQTKIGDTQKELYDLCATTALKKTIFDYRLCFTGKTRQEFIEQISEFLEMPDAPVTGNLLKVKKMAFVFSGQGSQWLGMGKRLMEEFDVFRENIEECSRAFIKYAPTWNLVKQLQASEEESLIHDIDYIQPALFAVQVALARLWISWGIVPDSVIGHSMGEVAAAHIANVIKLDDAAKIICRRSALMKTLRGKGTMMLVELSYEKATALCAQYSDLQVAVNNSPNNCIVGGLNDSIQALETYLNEQNIFCRRVKVDVASHTFQMEAIVPQLTDEFQDIIATPSDIVIYSSVLGSKIEGEEMTGNYWVRNVRSQVLFAKTIDAMIQDEHGVFVEVAPHPVLSMPIKESLKTTGKEAESLVVGSTLREADESSEMVKNMAQLFSVGAPIRWQRLYRPAEDFIELPKYPWNRERFTIQDRTEEFATFSMKRNDGSFGHPFLEQYIELADQVGVDIWETRLHSENIPFLNAYRASGVYQFPVSAYLEMVEAAIDEISGDASSVKHSLYIQKPVVLSDEYSPVLQLKITAQDEHLSHFEIFVANLKDKTFKKRKWETVARGEVHFSSEIITHPDQPVKSWVRGHKESLPKKDYYTFLETLGIDYDADYQCVEKIWNLGDRVVAQVVPTDKIRKEQAKYKLHPLVIGSCIRTMFLIMPTEMHANLQNYDYHVASIEEMYISNQSEYQSPFWAECELAPYDKDKVVKEGVSGHFTLYDNNGKVIAKSQNFKLCQKLKDTNDAHRYFYDVIWQKQENIAPSLKKVEKQTHLLFRQGDFVGKTIEQELLALGHEVYTVSPNYIFKASPKHNRLEINPLQQSDYGKIWDFLREQNVHIHNIVYAWSTEKDVTQDWDAEILENTALFYNMGLVNLVKSVNERYSKGYPLLSIVTKEAQAIENASPSMVNAMLWGIAKVIRNEHSEFECQTIDVSSALGGKELRMLLARLVKERVGEEIVLRGGAQYVPRLQNYTPSRINRHYTPIDIDKHGTYLVTGGMGGLGLAFAQWLVEKGATHIALLGRSKPSDVASQTMKNLQEKGARVYAFQADVSDETSLDKALQNIREAMPAIKGIFHTAGVLADSSLLNMKDEQFMKALAPKVQGAWNLHKLTLNDSLTCFVSFSSAASLLGLTGQSNYVAANTFLDSLAVFRREQGLPAISINWGAVSDVGLAAAAAHRGDRLEGEGIKSMDTELYLQLFEKIFVEEIPQVGILNFFFHEWKKIYTSYASSAFFELMETEPITNKPQTATTKSKADEWLTIGEASKQIQWIENVLREKTAAITKATASKISMTTSFKNLGVDSLMLVQLRNSLDEMFMLKLSVSSFFSAPTVKEYAKYLQERLLETFPAATQGAASTPADNDAPAHEQASPTPENYASMSLDELSEALDAELNNL